MANIQVFEYQNNKVRTVDVDGEAWFVLKDVCEILRMDTTQLKKVADRLDEDEKGRTLITTPGGMQETWIVNESGLYHVILRSDKPEAAPFRRWVTNDVLPEIRKTGSYSVAQPDPNLPPELAMVEGLLNSVKKLYITQQEQTEELGKVKEQVNLMCEVSSTSVGDDWRTACTNAIRAVAFKRGGQKHYAEVWNEVYNEMKANGFDVRKRLDNRRKAAIATGMHPTYVRKINALDVITDSKDKKLISGFISTVRKIAAAEGVKIAQKEEKSVAEQQYFDNMDDVEG